MPPAKFSCLEHWRLLPVGLRTRIWATYRPGQENDLAPTREYVEAARDALDWATAYEAERAIELRHILFIKSLCCLACRAGAPCDAAHVRMSRAELGKFNAMGAKPAALFLVPLCAKCHREDQHQRLGERAFWERLGIDPLAVAVALHEVTGLYDQAMIVIVRAWEGSNLPRRLL